MKNIYTVLFILLALTACKKKEEPKPPPPVVSKAAQAAKDNETIDALAAKALANKEDWTKAIDIYIDDILICSRAAPGQTKYIFRADAFETPPIALILLKTEADKIYACSIGENDAAPRYREIHLQPPATSTRFYPGELPKADSCLINSKVLDKSGGTAGWLAKISC